MDCGGGIMMIVDIRDLSEDVFNVSLLVSVHVAVFIYCIIRLLGGVI